MASAEVKVELEEEIQPSTSGRAEQMGEVEAEYCTTADMPRAMTISKELFYMDEMIARCYDWLSTEDKVRFDQMKVLAESIKQETGDYGLIKDLMARVVA